MNNSLAAVIMSGVCFSLSIVFLVSEWPRAASILFECAITMLAAAFVCSAIESRR